MSASEKLKALKATGLTCEHWTDHDASDLDVTDELIAVVEAAEKAGPGTTEPFASLGAALSALEEALGGDE